MAHQEIDGLFHWDAAFHINSLIKFRVRNYNTTYYTHKELSITPYALDKKAINIITTKSILPPPLNPKVHFD